MMYTRGSSSGSGIRAQPNTADIRNIECIICDKKTYKRDRMPSLESAKPLVQLYISYKIKPLLEHLISKVLSFCGCFVLP